ncbi:branched-chain amino acid ABC transporter permease [Pradoshia eiseniae]|uniref:Branched-chain amino acid ABC transporter permease n=2 Tax=Pradoshia eiseniae TaxID=2064768 RepID=A0A2S7N0Q3_9BACI|nr:branched-chain amino acid ABC transporter permease [Pradoshia eiseniae]
MNGLRAGVSIAIGYFPVAVTFGLLSKSSGLSLAETFSMSLIVYAGAAQYIALNLLSLGIGIAEIIMATFILNSRHFLMSASIQARAAKEPLWKKLIYAFGITDETFSVASMKSGKITAGFMFGLGGIAYVSWLLSTLLGYLFGASLPDVLKESMGIALYAMFIALLMPALSKSRKILTLALSGAGLNFLFTYFEFLTTGWSLIVSALLASIGVEWMYGNRKGRNAA